MKRDDIIKVLKGKDMRIAYHYSRNSHWKYGNAQEWNESIPYNHRDVLPNEVVFDFDEEEYEDNAHNSAKIATRLKQTGMKYSVWVTGGKGMHCLPSKTKLFVEFSGRWSCVEMRSLEKLLLTQDVFVKTPFGKVKILSVCEREQHEGEKLVKIEVGGGRTWISSQDHLHPVLRNGVFEVVRADEIIMTDRMLVDVNSHSRSTTGTYELGRLIGLFLADGSYQNTTTKNRLEFTFDKTEMNYAEFVKNYCEVEFGANVQIKEKHNCIRVIVYSAAIKSLMQEFCIGTVARDKGLKSKVYGMSWGFRTGLLDGWLEGDGLHEQYQDGESISKGLVSSMLKISSSIGLLARMTRFKRKEFPGYRYRLHITKKIPECQKTQLKGIFTLPIKKINRNYVKKTKLTDITIDSEEALFTLADGRVTHNCHTFWKGLDKVAEPRLLKNLIADHFLQGTKIKVDRQLMGRHMVRMEFGHHEKALPQEKFKEVKINKGHFEENEIPQEIWPLYKQKVVSYAISRMRWEGKEIPKEEPYCMKYFMSQEYREKRDGGKRAMFVVASYYRDLPDKELGSLLLQYNEYVLKDPLSKEQIYAIIMSVRNHKGRPVGCAYRHELLKDIGCGFVVEKCGLSRDAKRIGDTHDNKNK